MRNKTQHTSAPLQHLLQTQGSRCRLIPMLFSTIMVQALLDGRKTQTRRIVKNKLPIGNYEETMIACPYKKGDIIWVRETWTNRVSDFEGSGMYLYKADGDTPKKWRPSIFMPKAACRLWFKVVDVRFEWLREISEQDAIAEGIEVIHIAEGQTPIYLNYLLNQKLGTVNPCKSYATLWDKINGSGSWLANPFVWVIEFERVECPEGFR